MYEINCEECGRIGFHPSRTAAEMKAERHAESATGDDVGGGDHECGIEPMEG